MEEHPNGALGGLRLRNVRRGGIVAQNSKGEKGEDVRDSAFGEEEKDAQSGR